MQACRLIVERASPGVQIGAGGAYHMAVDEILLKTAARAGTATLRFYRWDVPTLSLGYFQQLAQRDTHAASRDCELVRRASGGGAILHHHELTYSFTSLDDTRFGAIERYLAFHETLVETLAESFGIQAKLQTAADGLTNRPFLCFQRRASGDVIVDGQKIGGSAQRRWKNALLQHGSVLLGQSVYAPELPGLQELAGFTDESAELVNSWLEKLVSRLKIDVETGGLADTEQEGAIALVEEKFGAVGWTSRR